MHPAFTLGVYAAIDGLTASVEKFIHELFDAIMPMRLRCCC